MAVKRWLLLLLVVKAALYQNMGNVNRLRDNTAYTLSLSQFHLFLNIFVVRFLNI